MSNSVVAAITRLIHSEVERDSGHYAGLRAFIDPGRGDIYIEGINGQRIAISVSGGTVTYCDGDWRNGVAEAAPL